MTDYERVVIVIEHLTEHRREQPSLDELAEIVDVRRSRTALTV